MQYHKKNSGFSEIELVTFIVLLTVIVILVRTCQDFTHLNKIKSNIVQIEKYKTAIGQFKTKYAQLPGDLNNAKKLWPECADVPALKTTCNGNGDGLWNNGEGFYVFEHLSRAEMVDEIYSATPASLEETIFPVIGITGQNIVPMGSFGLAADKNISSAFFNYPLPANSFMVYFESNIMGDAMPTQRKVETLLVKETDIKLDDGNGATGDIRASYDNTGFFGAYKTTEQCTDSRGVYKDDEDNLYYCNFIMRY